MKRLILKDTSKYIISDFRGIRRKSDREHAWLESRSHGIGGSDMATILGLNRYKTPYDLWLEKTHKTTPPDISGKWAVLKGNALENTIRSEWIRPRHHEWIITDGTGRQFINRDRPYMRASLDGIIQRDDDPEHNGILEIKTANVHRAVDWKTPDGETKIPDYYLPQVVFYAAVTGWTWGVFVADIGEAEPIEVRFDIDQEDIDAVTKAAEDFWRFVQSDTPPTLTGGDVDRIQTASQVPDEYEEVADPTIEDTLRQISQLKDDEKHLHDQRTSLEDQVKAYVGDTRRGIITQDGWQAGYKTIHYKARPAQTAREAYDQTRFQIKHIEPKTK